MENNRRTRIADFLIQEFFSIGKCEVLNYFESVDSKKEVFLIVLNRLKNEHNLQDKDLIIDQDNFRLYKKQFKHV